MCATPWNGHQVVLAGRVHRDVLDQHELVVVLVERRREDVVRVLPEARRRSRRRRGPPAPGCPAAPAGRGPPPPRAAAPGPPRRPAPGRPRRGACRRVRLAGTSLIAGPGLRRRPTGELSPAGVPVDRAAVLGGLLGRRQHRAAGPTASACRSRCTGAREGRLTTGAQMRAMSSLDSVSFSISSSTSWSRTAGTRPGSPRPRRARPRSAPGSRRRCRRRRPRSSPAASPCRGPGTARRRRCRT